jgi:putative ABC transport system permease protein
MDMIVRPAASSSLANMSAASADLRVGEILKAMPHVKVVAPANIKLTMTSNVENITGIDFASYNALRPFTFLEGGPFQHPLDVIIDDLQAKSGKGLKLGDTLKIMGKDFTVCGIVEHGKGSRKFISLQTMDEIDGTPNKASLFYVKTEDAPRFQEDVRNEIHGTDGMQDWNVQTADEYLSMLTPEHIPAFNAGLRVVIGIAVVIGFLVIFQSMYTAVMERTREIGILKSMGAGKLNIVSVVLRETGLLAVVGVGMGVAATYALRSFLHARFPTMSFQLTGGWVARAIVISLLGALLGALYPAAKAAAKDPIDALSYE